MILKKYWIVDPEEQTINVYLHDGMGFRLMESEYNAGDKLCATVFPELEIDVRVLPIKGGQWLQRSEKSAKRRYG